MEKQIHKKLLELDPSMTGTLSITESGKVVTVKADVNTSLTNFRELAGEIAKRVYPGKLIAFDVKVNSGLTVLTHKGSISSSNNKKELDRVDIVYNGMLDISQVVANEEYKFINHDKYLDIYNAINVLGFISPIILDNSLKVIDGNLRLEIAKELGWTKIPAVVISGDGKRSDFLRLAINRSNEFQRWNYEEVDAYVDSVPQAQPLLEPLGFFGKKLLPESFFANTVIQYRIDPFSEQQKAYSQDEGLADWAKRRRDEIKAAEAKKKEQKRKPTAGAVSLFDLQPKEEDFIETYDIDKEVDAHVEKMKEVAGVITENYDAKRKAEMEARGQAWQGSRRSSKQVAADERKAFIEQLNEHTELTEDMRKQVLEQLDDVTTADELEALIEGVKLHD